MGVRAVGLMITERCNLQCDHCMFSCTGKGQDMSYAVAKKTGAFIRFNDIYDVNIYGGEPFLNIELFDMVWKEVYDETQHMFISTNGTFLCFKKKREYFYKILNQLKNNRECSGIRISDTIYHQQCRTERQEQWLKRLRWYMNDPWTWWDDQGFDEYTCVENPFEDLGEETLYIDTLKQTLMNPSGRALKNGLDNGRECYCPLTTEDVDDYFNSDELHINVRPNGDITLCCTCDGGTVGNILEPDMSPALILERTKQLNTYFKVTRGVHSQTKMRDLCAHCRKCHVTPDGIHVDGCGRSQNTAA